MYLAQMVIVGDDCALPPPRGIAGRRGLAGTILVHKVPSHLLFWLSFARDVVFDVSLMHLIAFPLLDAKPISLTLYGCDLIPDWTCRMSYVNKDYPFCEGLARINKGCSPNRRSWRYGPHHTFTLEMRVAFSKMKKPT